MHSLDAGYQLGKYEIVRPLGKGGMGEIYVALDRRLSRTVAVKLLPAHVCHDPAAVERFRREARAASGLNHPHIVTIYDIGDCERGLYIAMELIEGQTLRELAREKIPVQQLLVWGEQIARALAASHEAGVLHRDIKPENIMIRKDGYAKVLDFGLASLTSTTDLEKTATGALTTGGSFLGTLRYMSPEHARGERCSPASDIFSLGIVLYELATGHHPFGAGTALVVVHSILSEAVKQPRSLRPDLPESLEQFLLSMLDKSEARRPRAAELADFFAAAISSPRPDAETVILRSAHRSTVGREAERVQLREALRRALSGCGSVMAIAGEPGIGKSTLAEDFLTEASGSGTNCLIARGRCSERLAGTEAYLPLLEALDSILKHVDSGMASSLMRSVSPSWYTQLASIDPGDSSAAHLLADVKTGSQERMKRELGIFLHELATKRPLIIFLDDLHWADPSTVDALSYLAGRITSSRILFLATYRLSDMMLAKHPMLRVKSELQSHGLFQELPLDFLSREEIEQYLALEFPNHRFSAALAEMIHAKTEGNALFMADLIHYMRDRGVISLVDGVWSLTQQIPDVAGDLPQSVRVMVDQKIAGLQEPDMRLLATASVQGYVFDSAIVSDVAKEDPADVEDRLDELEHVHRLIQLVEETELPDRTLTVRYRFVHVLYQHALLATLRPTRRVTLSKGIGEALLRRYGSHADPIANEIAVLFESGREYIRASEYYRKAAQNATMVFASQEAVAIARRGLAAAELALESPERSRAELALLITLGNALIATSGYAAPEVTTTFARAHRVCESLDDRALLYPVLYGEWVSQFVSGKSSRALELARGFVSAAIADSNEALVVGYRMLGWGQFCTGVIPAAHESYGKALAIWRPELRKLAFQFGHEPGMTASINQALACWLLGNYPEAEERFHQSQRMASEINHANSRAYSLVFAAVYCCWRADFENALAYAQAALALAREQGLALWKGWGVILVARALLGLGRTTQIDRDLRAAYDAAMATGTRLFCTYHLAILAEVHLSEGSFDQALREANEGLTFSEENDENFWRADLYRLRAEITLQSGGSPEQAEQDYRDGLKTASAQAAHSLALRLAVSMVRNLKTRDKREIETVIAAFPPGAKSQELDDAKELLAAMAGPLAFRSQGSPT